MRTVKIEQVVIGDITELEVLKSYLPPIDDIADEKLKAEITEQGIREPLSLAMIDKQVVVLDGHNRLRIASDLKYKTVPAVFYDHITDLTDAQQFMINNQLGKRNLGVMERIKIILQLEPQLKEQAKERQRGVVQNSAEAGKVIEKLAEMANVSRATIAQAKTILATNDPELIAIAGNGISINKATKYAGFSAEKRKAKIDAAIHKISDKEAEEATEEAETITIDGKELIKISDLSYLQKTSDDSNFGVYGIVSSENKNTIVSIVQVLDNCATVAKYPPFFDRIKTITIFKSDDSDKTFNDCVLGINLLLDNIKTAKRLADPARAIARKAYLELHPYEKPAKPVKAAKPPTEKQLAKIEKDRVEAEAKAKKAADKLAAREAKIQKSEAEKRVLSGTQLDNLTAKIYDMVTEDIATSRKADIDEVIIEVQKRIYVSKSKIAEVRKVATVIFGEKGITLKGKKPAKPAKEPKAPKALKALKAPTKAKTPAKAKAKKPTTPAEPAPAKFETTLGDALKATLPAKKKAPAKKAPAKKPIKAQQADMTTIKNLEKNLADTTDETKKAELSTIIEKLKSEQTAKAKKTATPATKKPAGEATKQAGKKS